MTIQRYNANINEIPSFLNDIKLYIIYIYTHTAFSIYLQLYIINYNKNAIYVATKE